MWTQTHTRTYEGLRKEDVWSLLTDVNHWTRWHGDLEACTMEGPFVVGNHFLLTPKGMGAVKITLTDIQEGREFTDCTPFFGAKMYDTHSLEETPEGLKLSNRVVVKGPLSWLWVRLVARHVAASSPEEMDALAALARAEDA